MLSAQVFTSIAAKGSQQRVERKASRSTSETSSGIASPVGGIGFFAKSSPGKSSVQRNSTSTGGGSGFFSKPICASRQGADSAVCNKVRRSPSRIEVTFGCAVLHRDFRSPPSEMKCRVRVCHWTCFSPQRAPGQDGQ